jgi:hypothetical protein
MPAWHMLAGQQPKENWQTLYKRASFVPIQVVEEVRAMTFVGTNFQTELEKTENKSLSNFCALMQRYCSVTGHLER